MDEKDRQRGWFEIVLPTTSPYAEPLTTALAELGYASCELREHPSGTVDVVVYCRVADHDSAVNTARSLEKRLPDGLTANVAGELAVAAVDESVWTENWKRYFSPTEIGRRLLIVPPWEAAAATGSGRVVVVINPAMAFGTGHHETTASCLEVIDELVEPGWRVADVGCGSGILAIAALRIGAAAAVATDNDPLAVSAARDEDLPLHIRLLRDLVGPALRTIRIDDDRTCRRAASFAAKFLPEVAEHVEHYCEPRPLFDRYGIDDEVARALKPRVEMKCGGFLVIEQTEAMTTIDVNTGSFLGGSRFEETVYRTNLEAAGMIPRQLRLRNLGGIIIIDFIDMEDPEHQRNVLRALEKACEGDRARLAFEGFSSLGLVQMSRKRTRASLAQQLCEPCPLCQGGGLTKTSETICAEIFRAILHDARTLCSPKVSEYLIRAPESVVDRLLDEDADHLAAVSSQVEREIRIQVEPCYGPNQFDVVVLQDANR